MSEFVEAFKVVVAISAFALSFASFVISRRASARAKKTETITHLLGAKETVAFAALKILRDGLPEDNEDRQLLVAALVQACVFAGSDRARALLYRTVELNRARHKTELLDAAKAVSDTFDSTDRYEFEKEDLDLDRGRRRLAALLKVIESS